MTARQLLGVWIATLLLAGGIAVGLYRYSKADPFKGNDIAVIGSSLSRHAFPKNDPQPIRHPDRYFHLMMFPPKDEFALFGDDRTQARRAIAGVGEDELLGLLDNAIDNRVGTVLLEINPIVASFDFKAHDRPCDSNVQWARHVATRYSEGIYNGLKRVRGKKSWDPGTEKAPKLYRAMTLDPADIARRYPLRIHRLCQPDRFARQVERARVQGTRIVLIKLPRSPYAQKVMGPEQVAAEAAMAKRMARTYELPLFMPGGRWSDAQFADQGHVNIWGRIRLLSDFEAWSQEHGL